jgi:hypothetical protein
VVRRDASGAVTVAAEPEAVEAATFAMKLGQLARMVAHLPPPEKAAFSAAVRSQGNAKFAQKDWVGAEDLYMQSLVGLDFGPGGDATGNATGDDAGGDAAIRAGHGVESGAESSAGGGFGRVGTDTADAAAATTRTAIQVPVLCNLAACALAQRKWLKAGLLCDYALALDPMNWKARARKVNRHSQPFLPTGHFPLLQSTPPPYFSSIESVSISA